MQCPLSLSVAAMATKNLWKKRFRFELQLQFFFFFECGSQHLNGSRASIVCDNDKFQVGFDCNKIIIAAVHTRSFTFFLFGFVFFCFSGACDCIVKLDTMSRERSWISCWHTIYLTNFSKCTEKRFRNLSELCICTQCAKRVFIAQWWFKVK